MLRRCLQTLCTVLLMTPAVWAQMTYPAPTPAKIDREGSWVEYVIGAGALIGCLLIAFKPAKRSNID